MSYDGWMQYNGKEFINLSRTAQLADVMGITSLWPSPGELQWIQDDLGGLDYDDITTAPWYDPGFAPSTEFAGLVVLSVPNLDDSTLTRSTTEYIGDGGAPGLARNATLPLVWNVAIIASTDRGADFGKRWMDRQLKNTKAGPGGARFSLGGDLYYFRYAGDGAPKVHRRDVRLTRASTVTRKKRDSCSVTWWVTFTMTDHDSYEYGEADAAVASLGGTVTGDELLASGTATLVQATCPVYDYSPIFDPLYPALIPSPTAPNFYPDGWAITPGRSFKRYWARFHAPEPTSLFSVPVITLTTTVDARMVRVSIWGNDWINDQQCGPVFSAVISYLPAGVTFYIDAEQKACYLWDGFSAQVRRTDTVVYSEAAGPVQWTAFGGEQNLNISLDTFDKTGGLFEGEGTIRAALSLVPKSD